MNDIGQTLRLRISKISLDIFRRLYDTKIELNVGALYLEDSLRPKTQRFLIRSVNLDDEGHFLRKFRAPAPIEGKDKKSVDFARTFPSSEIGQRNVLTSREPSGSMCKENNILNGIENFAKLTVTQVFDSLSPYKYEINRRVSTAFEKDEKCDENNDKSNNKSNEKGIEKNNGSKGIWERVTIPTDTQSKTL